MEVPGAMCSLYVGDLDSSVDENILFSVFQQYGNVLSVKICRDAVTRGSLGYGYVNYRFQEEAEKAIKTANFSTLNGKQCRIMWSNRNDPRRKKGIGNVFIKNIHPDLDSKSLFDAFSSFGPIMSCKVCVDELGLSRGFGFIQFYDEDGAKEALSKANGVIFKNKKLVVVPFLSKSERTDARPVDPNKFTNVFIKNIKDVWTIDDVKKAFSKFGEITSCVIQKDPEGKSLGFGFVNFAKPESAAEARKEMDGFKLPNGEKLYVSKAMKKNERKAFLKKEHERRRMELAKKFQDHNLYVKNFDENFTDEKLKQEFSVFGNIKSCQVMKDEKGKSKGFGFVCFESAEHAKNALNALNGKIIDNKTLFVTIAQTKEDRRRMLDERFANSNYRHQYPYPTVPFLYSPQPVFPFPGPPMPPMTRLQPNMQMNKNMTRGMMNSAYVHGNNRMVYGYNQPPVFPQQHTGGHRPRMPNQGRGGHYQGSPMNPRLSQPVQGRLPNQQGPQVSVNQVVAEPQPKSRRDDKHHVKDEMLSADKVYELCQVTLKDKENHSDKKMVEQICGTVLEYLSRNPMNSDEAVKGVILDCYKQFVSRSESSKT